MWILPINGWGYLTFGLGVSSIVCGLRTETSLMGVELVIWVDPGELVHFDSIFLRAKL